MRWCLLQVCLPSAFLDCQCFILCLYLENMVIIHWSMCDVLLTVSLLHIVPVPTKLIALFRKLDCGNHQCEEICHADNCRGCELQPDVVVFCPCGKMRTAELLNGKERISCLDIIPTCGNTCGRFLPCAKYNGMW